MSEPTTEPGMGKVDSNPSDDPTSSAPDLATEVEKWRSLARKHEQNWKAVSTERDELKAATLTDAEKAIQQAREEGRKEGRAESSLTAAAAKLEAYAATNGVNLPSNVADYLDPSRLLDADGRPDMVAIAAFVDPFKPAPVKQPAFPQNVGIGPQGGGQNSAQLTRDDLQRMSATEINEARREGRLNQLMFGEP